MYADSSGNVYYSKYSSGYARKLKNGTYGLFLNYGQINAIAGDTAGALYAVVASNAIVKVSNASTNPSYSFFAGDEYKTSNFYSYNGYNGKVIN